MSGPEPPVTSRRRGAVSCESQRELWFLQRHEDQEQNTVFYHPQGRVDSASEATKCQQSQSLGRTQQCQPGQKPESKAKSKGKVSVLAKSVKTKLRYVGKPVSSLVVSLSRTGPLIRSVQHIRRRSTTPETRSVRRPTSWYYLNYHRIPTSDTSESRPPGCTCFICFKTHSTMAPKQLGARLGPAAPPPRAASKQDAYQRGAGPPKIRESRFSNIENSCHTTFTYAECRLART
ncbi:hypothetical protein B0T25DRAFT_67066 [Lasiosphaeria hispida]|uniref:Uncharacterized protein n=1 Tax=Lasiosphaeria hispida TaxID=260671 RepID=A0AAJ0HXH4_9PEZI|nr:hypothetical protein B0T25DRAFT_67066 [Lasiosphaeria hispida]